MTLGNTFYSFFFFKIIRNKENLVDYISNSKVCQRLPPPPLPALITKYPNFPVDKNRKIERRKMCSKPAFLNKVMGGYVNGWDKHRTLPIPEKRYRRMAHT